MRQEHDRFGAINLPSSCLYGIGTARCLENLSFSGSNLGDYPDFLQALLSVKRACAKANLNTGALTPSLYQAITTACLELARTEHSVHFPVDMLHGGGGIAFNVNMNEVIANFANLKLGHQPGQYCPVHPSAHVNVNQSTADVCHTALRLAIITASSRLDKTLRELTDAFTRKRCDLLPIVTLARTCLQDAMTVSLGEAFGSFAAVVERRRNELNWSVSKLKKVNLGGTVIGSGDGASSDYRAIILEMLCETTSLDFSARENLYDAAQNSDDIGAVSAQLRLLAQCLIKISKDLRLLSSGPAGGFGEITLPPLQDGSSFFKGKVNPVVPETVIQACIQVLGADTSMQQALEHAELNLNVFEPSMAKNSLDAVNMLTDSLRLLVDRCIPGVEANQERCASLANYSQLAKMLAPRM